MGQKSLVRECSDCLGSNPGSAAYRESDLIVLHRSFPFCRVGTVSYFLMGSLWKIDKLTQKAFRRVPGTWLSAQYILAIIECNSSKLETTQLFIVLKIKSIYKKKRSLGKARAAWQSQALQGAALVGNPRTSGILRSAAKKERCPKRPFLKPRNQWQWVKLYPAGHMMTRHLI